MRRRRSSGSAPALNAHASTTPEKTSMSTGSSLNTSSASTTTASTMKTYRVKWGAGGMPVRPAPRAKFAGAGGRGPGDVRVLARDRVRERAAALEQPGARLEQVAADEQHHIVAIIGLHLRHALERHAARRHGHRRGEAVPRPARRIGDRQAGLARIAEAAGVIREDRRIGAEEPEDLAEKHLGCDAAGAAEGRVGEKRNAGGVRQ